MRFAEWLHQPEPQWKLNMDRCDPFVFKELKMSKEDVEKILEKLDEYNVFKKS